MAKRRIGIMGGSFNPIHLRHLQIAASALNELSLDNVIFIPNGNPPHKRQELADAAHRMEMTRLAVSPYKKFIASDIETTRCGVVYTIDTLMLLHREYLDAEFVCLIGEDTLHDLPHWRQPDEVFGLCSFAVCPRSSHTAELAPDVAALRERGARFQFLRLEPVDLSASDIRSRIASGKSVDTLLTPEVYEYIRVTGLYGCKPLPGNAANAYNILKEDLDDERLIHSMAVARTAAQLAAKHGLNTDDCEFAGLLHDCAKCMDLPDLKTIARENRLRLSEIEMQSNALLHGPVGAVVAQTKYGIHSPEILGAIAAHTTGYPGMSDFEILVYLADKIEPYRNHIPDLYKIRLLAENDLYEAAYQMMLHSREHVLKKRLPVHPQTDQTIRWMLGRIRERREQPS